METYTKEQFDLAMQRFEEARQIIMASGSQEECIRYFMDETGLSREECEKAYDFISRKDFKRS